MQSLTNNIIQWNLNGLYRNLDDIKLIINLHKPIALCLQEINLKSNDSPPKLNNYNCVTKNRQNYLRASGGVCISLTTIYRGRKYQ